MKVTEFKFLTRYVGGCWYKRSSPLIVLCFMITQHLMHLCLSGRGA